ncbi:LmeA family phospholipid-binding protein [Microlunatus sp. Y2014]|uniref:LmeA family phospholipid-binding protein n=1 Tax=Microlunatus sp. Y2014 TaxID=3418488 RepID=UPI003DA79288
MASLKGRDGGTLIIPEQRTGAAPGSGPTPPEAVSARPAKPRGPRWFKPAMILVALALVATLLVLADTVGRQYAEGEVATRVQTELGLTSPPAVSIGGTSFLVQAASQNFAEVSVTGDRVEMDAAVGRVTLTGVDLTLSDVSSQDWFTTITVGTLHGSGTAPWETVSALAGTELRHADPDAQGRGRVVISQNLEFRGLSVPITLTGRPEINAATGQLTLAEPTVAVSGIDLPAELVSDLLTRNLKPIDLELPHGLQVTDVTSTPDGMVLTLAGSDITFGGP